MSNFEPVSLLRLCKIAHSDPRLIPARMDACPHVTEIIGASPQPRNFWKQPDEKGDGAKPEATAAGGHPQNMVLAVANEARPMSSDCRLRTEMRVGRQVGGLRRRYRSAA